MDWFKDKAGRYGKIPQFHPTPLDFGILDFTIDLRSRDE
jgi:hypothetical protein